MKKEQEQNTMIVFNHMFTGDYLNDNLGHEVINFFKADDGANYIYLCKDGKYSRNEIPKYIIQVRRPHNTVRTLEIVNIAMNLELFKSQQGSITYGGIPVTEIFENNKEQQEVCITFKAGLVIKPKTHQYICYHDKNDIPGAMVLDETIINEKGEEVYRFNISQQLREYFTDGDDFYTLDAFCTKAFDDYTKGKDWVNVDKDFLNEDNEEDTQILPADIYGIGTWELAYSNAFKYFLENNGCFLKSFCKLCLSKHGKSPELQLLGNNAKPEIKREWQHIDLLIDYGKYLFVIENKIFSDLNGKDKDQLTEYEKTVNGTEEYRSKEKIFILLTPNHNKINIDNNWTHIYYKDVYEICPKVIDEHFSTFVRMIELHIEEDYNYGAMKRKFKRALSLLKNQNLK